jgi:hypothetical protein
LLADEEMTFSEAMTFEEMTIALYRYPSEATMTSEETMSSEKMMMTS